MTHVVSEACIRCKYTDCVDVCPVDCFREGPNMLVIDPDECIDCAVCIPECPVNAIYAEEDLPADQIAFIKINAELAVADGWKSITKRKPALPDADDWKDKTDKVGELAPNQPTAPVETDALIVGAGPVGLFQAFQLGLLEISCHIVDALPAAGGQCVALYGDKPIYDIPGTPVTSGRDLAQSLLAQVAPFKPSFHFGEQVATLERQADRRLLLTTSAGKAFLAKTVFIAAGVGAFVPKRIAVEGIAQFEGSSLFYHPESLERFAGQTVVVNGGDDIALDTAIALSSLAKQVTLVHRRDGFQADEATVASMRALVAAGKLAFKVGQPTAFDGRVLQIATPDATSVDLPLDALVACLGISPRLGPIADWGLELERKQVPVDTEKYQTREHGVFAVGDINTYPGKKKLIVCGFHEATLAAWGAAAIVFPGKAIPLQYTTTSTRLHELLGVAPAR